MSFEVTFELRAKKYKMLLEPSELISKVKSRLVELLKENSVTVCESELRLIFGAKILDDAKTVEECKVTENAKVFLTVRSNKPTAAQPTPAPPAPTPATTPLQPNASSFGAAGLLPGFNTPGSMFQGFPANPQAAISALQNNPEMQQFALQQIGTFVNNPQLIDMLFPSEFANKSEGEKEALRNTLLQQFKMVHSNPEIMTSMLQSLNNNPAMAASLGQHMHVPQAPLGQQMQASSPLLTGHGVPAGAVPCPHGCYAINYVLQTPSQVVGGSAMQSPGTPVIPHDAKTRFSEQLKALNDMGFCNEEANLKALVRANGDLNMAVEILVQTMGSL